jgi:hypothetical protein
VDSLLSKMSKSFVQEALESPHDLHDVRLGVGMKS